jgi:adenylate cyclase
MAENRVQRRLAAILAADVAGYSRLMGEDEEGTLLALTAHRNEFIDPCIAEHRGRLVKTTGDGLLVEFASVVDAVRCAVAFQEGMSKRNASAPESRRVTFRIGVNLGDVIIQDDDIFGDGVNIASRLESLAEPGGICISDAVHQSVRSKIDLPFRDLGAQRVKNIGEPVHAFHLRPDAAAPTVSKPLEAPPLPEKPSIAVLPFENMSADAEQDYFSDGITEDIITELSKISGLFVIARHSAFAYKGKPVSLKQVGHELGVRYVLEGSVRKAGSRLRITVQLINALTDHHLWAERYDRDIEDIFSVQDEVARSVASALAVALKPEEGERLSHPPTSNIEAYDIYLRTRSAPWPPTRENILTARSAYRRIAEIDPSFAGGFAGQSMTHSFAVMFGFSEQVEEDARLAFNLAETAFQLDDSFAQAWSALGFAHLVNGRHGDAAASARRAVELQPGDADAHTYLAMVQFCAGEAEDAYAEISAALRLDPNYVNGPYLNVMGIICFCAGRYEEAIEVFQRNVDRGGPLGVPALTFHTAAYSAVGRVEDAKASAETLLRFFPAFSLSRYRFLLLFKNSADVERVRNALRAVGLPE